jgi:hypothetical protein
VNGVMIGSGPEISSGYLLQDGDEVQVMPYWKFTLRQPDSPPRNELTKLQTEEVKVRVTPNVKHFGLLGLFAVVQGQVHFD